MNNTDAYDVVYATRTYEMCYMLNDGYAVANKVECNTNFSCELYFNHSMQNNLLKQ